MTPYYQDDYCTIYHGDCREVLPFLDKMDLLLTDPPYGIGTWSSTGGNSLRQEEVDEINKWDKRPDKETFDLMLRSAKYHVIWGGNYFFDYLGSTRMPLIWDKGIRGMHYADGEMAWTSFDYGTLRILQLNIANTEVKNKRYVQTQKPIQLMKWSISLSRLKSTIVDSHMGSGTTLRAAKDLQIKSIGIDDNEKCCEIAAKRLSQEVFKLDL